jgi:hypothetical protein
MRRRLGRIWGQLRPRRWSEDLLNGIDIGLVTCKGLDGFACSNIPNFGRSIASTRNEQIGIGCERDTTGQL